MADAATMTPTLDAHIQKLESRLNAMASVGEKNRTLIEVLEREKDQFRTKLN
jgi:hypothetical protein